MDRLFPIGKSVSHSTAVLAILLCSLTGCQSAANHSPLHQGPCSCGQHHASKVLKNTHAGTLVAQSDSHSAAPQSQNSLHTTPVAEPQQQQVVQASGVAPAAATPIPAQSPSTNHAIACANGQCYLVQSNHDINAHVMRAQSPSNGQQVVTANASQTGQCPHCGNGSRADTQNVVAAKPQQPIVFVQQAAASVPKPQAAAAQQPIIILTQGVQPQTRPQQIVVRQPATRPMVGQVVRTPVRMAAAPVVVRQPVQLRQVPQQSTDRKHIVVDQPMITLSGVSHEIYAQQAQQDAQSNAWVAR